MKIFPIELRDQSITRETLDEIIESVIELRDAALSQGRSDPGVGLSLNIAILNHLKDLDDAT